MDRNENSTCRHVAGVRVDLISKNSLVEELAGIIRNSCGEPALSVIHTLNPEICMHAWRHTEYQKTLNAGTFNVVDGVGLQLALRRSVHQRVQRNCGSDLIYDLAALCHEASRTLMLLGGTPSRLNKARIHLQQRFPGLRVVGNAPPFSSSSLPPNQNDIVQLVVAEQPAVLAICLGAPKQEIWIQENKGFLALQGVRVAAGLGGTIDFLSGEIPRAPVFVRKIGFEWLYRLYKEPKRWKRQISTLPNFLVLAIFNRNFISHE